MKGFALVLALLFAQSASTTTTGVISGRVVYSDGTPAGQMLLILTPLQGQNEQTATPPRRRSAFTNEQGIFQQTLPPGRYLISVSTTPAVFYPGVLAEAEAQPVVVAAGTRSDDLTVSIPPSASGVTLEGRVSIPPNYPVARENLSVELSRAGLSVPIAADGTFRFRHVRPGDYVLMTTAPGSSVLAIPVRDRDVTGIPLVVPPLVPVSASISFPGNGARTPIVMQIEGIARNAGPLAEPYRAAVPVAAGRISAALPPGEYRLRFNPLPQGYYVASITDGANNLIDQPLRIDERETPVVLAINMAASGGVHVAGRVTTTANLPARDRRIRFHSVLSEDIAEGSINADGSFEFPKILPGAYSATVALTSTLSSSPVRVLIPNREISNIEIAIPSPREVSGRVAVDGNGPPPKFSLIFAKGLEGMSSSPQTSVFPAVSLESIGPLVRSGIAGVQALQVDIRPLPDGSFSLRLPDGEYRLLTALRAARNAGIPPAYFVRSATAGSADLGREPLRVSENNREEIQIGFGTTEPNPWVRVSGRVTGLSPAQGVFRVALEGGSTAAIETFLDSEGKFEFPVVLRNTDYQLKLVPQLERAPEPTVRVTDKDVSDVRLVVPPQREIVVRTVVEGNTPIPAFLLSLNGTDSRMNVLVKPDPNGVFRALLPEDERRVLLESLPLGYEIRSITYGATNLQRERLNIGASQATSELRIALAPDPAAPWGSLRGRVTGLDPNHAFIQLVLRGVTSFVTFETTVGADGGFNFQRIPQGTYMASLEGTFPTSRLTPNFVTVSGPDLVGIQLAAPPRPDGPLQPPDAEPQTGTRVVEIGQSAPVSSNEASAVANLRTVNTALVTYLSASGGQYGNIKNLIDAGLLDDSFNEVRAGFRFSLVSTGSEYVAAAIPVDSYAGRFAFFSTPDAIVRYSTLEALAPASQGGRPVQ